MFLLYPNSYDSICFSFSFVYIHLLAGKVSTMYFRTRFGAVRRLLQRKFIGNHQKAFYAKINKRDDVKAMTYGTMKGEK